MSNWGIRVSQKGYDAQTASDSQLLFSSSWPLLKIEAQGAFTTSLVENSATVYSHNLGYKPFFMIFETTDGKNRVATGLLDGDRFGVNTTELKFFGSTLRTGAASFYYYVFRLPLTTDYTAPIINQTDDSQIIVDDYGFKIAKVGSDISSTDYRDYVLHSSARSPMIHKVEYSELNVFDGTYYSFTSFHDLSYTPWFRSFYNQADIGGSDTSYLYPFFGGNGSTILLATSGQVKIQTSVSGCYGSTVMFKDPFNL